MQQKIDEFLAEPMAQKLLFFNEMLTPSLVRLAYWLCLLAIFWNGLALMFSGGFWHFLEGIVFIAMGAILARIAAELIMVLFKINENIKLVAENSVLPILEKPSTASDEAPATNKKTAATSKKTTKKKVSKKA